MRIERDNIFTRPNLSARIPKRIPPSNIPKLVTVEIAPASVVVRPNSPIIDDSANERNMISMFSKPNPAETKVPTLT